MTARPAYLIEAPVDRAPSPDDPLRTAIKQLRIESAIFLRAEYREAWAYESLPGRDTAQFLAPGHDSLAFFHVVAVGRCWIEVGGQKHWAEAGDVVVLPYGDQHRMGGVDHAELVPVTTFIPPPPWPQMPVIRYGQEGARTDVICGYLLSDDSLFDPALRVFPPVFVVRPPPGPAADWVRANVDFAVQQTRMGGPAFGEVSSRLPEMLLIEVLRLHLSTAPASTQGLVAALRDPVLSKALALVHAEPGRKWSVIELAAGAAVSRSVLDDRFRSVLGTAPMRYVAQWRLHVARDLLRSTNLSVAAVARRVGYEAEEAFSRAFKREYDVSPALWRLRVRPKIR
jgi:AraC-like DNA-binding protein